MVKMKGLLLVVIALGLWATPGWSQGGAAANTAAWDKLKNLAGEWEGKTPDGKTVTVSYRLVSNESALVETLSPPGEEMVTVYHIDGDSLMLTHYCAANNQPRMRATPSAGVKELTFKFVDATNLQSPSAGHMAGLTLTFEDDNHIAQKWTWVENGQQKDQVFRLTRKL
jgi:hypothetical protein